MRKTSRRRKTKKKPEPPNELLERLKEIAGKVGLEVREEKLLPGLGYTVRGGACRVGEEDVVLLDKNVSADERIEVLSVALAERDLDSVYIEPEIRVRISGPVIPAEGEAPTAPTIS